MGNYLSTSSLGYRYLMEDNEKCLEKLSLSDKNKKRLVIYLKVVVASEVVVASSEILPLHNEKLLEWSIDDKDENEIVELIVVCDDDAVERKQKDKLESTTLLEPNDRILFRWFLPLHPRHCTSDLEAHVRAMKLIPVRSQLSFFTYMSTPEYHTRYLQPSDIVLDFLNIPSPVNM
jgi:hypothetical protein